MTHNNSNCNSPRSPSSQPPSMKQQPPFLPPSIPTFLLGSHIINMPLHGQPFYSSPVWNGPVHQGTVQQQQDRPPSSGPSRHQRGGGHHRTGAQDRDQISHASAGTIARDRSDSNNAGTGGASRPPSRHPSTASSPYGRRSGASWTRRHTEDISAQQVPNMGSGRGASTGGSNPPVIASLSPPAPPPSTPASAASTSTATSRVSDEDAETAINTVIQRGSVEDEDYDAVSLGSDTFP